MVVNDLDYTNNVTLPKIVFTECKAKYGGAVYIQYKSERVPVRVTKCDFIKNTLTDPSSTSAKGSAFFLKTRKSQVNRCKFIENSGGSSVLEFQSISNEGRATNLNENEFLDIFDSFSISESKFEVTKTSMSSLRFIPGNIKTHFIINKCIFIGDLADNAYHIEGQWNDVTKQQLSMKINACKFSTDYKRSLNLDPSQNVDLNNLVFDYSGDADIIKRAAGVPWKAITIIIASALVVVAIVFISLIVYLKKMKSGKVISDGNDNEYANETFTLLNQNLI
ncbi:hypothetical protein M9Y10_019094 [Tritrichomonas musculus]|uniref:Uncharacterized protein n=1 Tax=Tritrichomonas musculus TaxID=1915356 RepID=A0ABR2HJI6_9EUKA